MSPHAVLWWLLVGHAVADFALQIDSMARGKNRHRKPEQTVWPYWLTSHALIHGGAVALATGVPALGALEAVSHWLIDFGKCENWYGIHTDQALHVWCKVAWWALISMGVFA